METFDYKYEPNMERYINRLHQEWKTHKEIVLAIDFDDTLSPWKFKDFDFQKVFELIREVKKVGAKVVIFTACKPDRYQFIKDYCRENGVEISSINENPIDLPYGNERKIYYNHLLDDRSGLMQAMTILSIAMMRKKCDAHPNDQVEF